MGTPLTGVVVGERALESRKSKRGGRESYLLRATLFSPEEGLPTPAVLLPGREPMMESGCDVCMYGYLLRNLRCSQYAFEQFLFVFHS